MSDTPLPLPLPITPRDFFAGLAMIALVEKGVGLGFLPFEAFKLADAMLAERERVGR